MPQVQSGKHPGTIDFIHTMLRELRTMAEAERCDMLAYLIGMAEVEAADIARGKRPARPARQEGTRSARGRDS